MTIQSVRVHDLRPTQIAVGMRLVKIKRKGLRDFTKKPTELVEYILARPIRVVLGPRHRVYIIDHHHLGLALLQEGFKTAPVQIEADLSKLSQAEFWSELERRAWVYPYDGYGRRRPMSDIPTRLDEMHDDPYRSLAGRVRATGGFAKTTTPYVEFQWAEYFRPLVERRRLASDFDKMVKKGRKLASRKEASHLPGYLAPKFDTTE